MPRFECPNCGRKKVIMAGKSKRCCRCNVKFVPVVITKPGKKKTKTSPPADVNPVDGQ